MRIHLTALFAGALLVGGCASANSGGPSSSNRSVITTEDMERVNARTAYDAVSALQPQWFRSRGPVSMTSLEQSAVSVFVDGIQLGGPDSLREIYVNDVQELRYFTPAEAGARFGMGHQSGVIEVTRKKGGG